MKDELTKADLKRLAPIGIATVVGVVTSATAVDMQENLYGRPNFWQGTVSKIEETIGMRPDFLTAFTYSLLVIELLQGGCALGEIQSDKFSHPERKKIFKLGKYLVPIVAGALFVGYELSGIHLNGMEYLDNSNADKVAIMAAAGIGLITAVASEIRHN